ncbi:MAG: Cd(II)/Pb(II)-responsive transcriptional regulator [Gemmatimonadales bacterium]|nr:Cd(II)/Pb(II)-responsive transcriptional regulator [Gemmatimonadales bacterium]
MMLQIGDLARRTGCQVETIRYYERQGLLPKPARSRGNYRVYGPDHLEQLAFIRHCRSLGMTLEEIATLLRYRSTPVGDCQRINSLVDAHIAEIETKIAQLTELRGQLVALREQCSGPTGGGQICGIMRGLTSCQCHDADPAVEIPNPSRE